MLSPISKTPPRKARVSTQVVKQWENAQKPECGSRYHAATLPPSQPPRSRRMVATPTFKALDSRGVGNCVDINARKYGGVSVPLAAVVMKEQAQPRRLRPHGSRK